MDDVRQGGLSEQARQAFAGRLVRELGVDQTLTGAPCAVYSIQGHTPLVVARPATLDALAVALALAAEAGAAVAPWGTGSRMALGYPPARLDLVVSLERLDRVMTYDPADLTITVEAGMTHSALNRTLADARQILPLDPPLPERATIGGTLATGSVGLRRSLYGAPRDVTLGIGAFDAAGQTLKAGGAVVKNATGYGMTRLYIGSLGSLCVIGQASFKLTPQPETEVTVLAAAPEPRQMLAAVHAVNALAVRPAAIAAMHVAALPELARLTPGHERRELLAIRLPGNEAVIQRSLAETHDALRRIDVAPLLTLDGASHDAFWASANDFPALRVHSREALVRVSALPAEMAQALDMAENLAGEHGLRLLWLTDLATGTLWLRLSAHIETAPDDERDGEAIGRDVAFATALRATLDALIRRWRLVTTLACPPAIKQGIALWGADPSGLDLMREVKRRFDPDLRLNPGRFVMGI
ncbi:MAG TPA: FAD-binding oxidoreductase [Ktedonobacterales bacterium]|jgi:glycolate oxidase FAD binding subunit|nr:FAD-binding oxidoreductase [Ktedonobacterales bacterium]